MEENPRARVPAERRRELLVEAGIAIAREDGGRAVTLARAAERCGVSKPIAYRHFGTLSSLLEAMEHAVIGSYESAVLSAIGEQPADHVDGRALLGAIAGEYIAFSLGGGAVYEQIRAARIATGSVDEPGVVTPEPYVDLVSAAFGIARPAAVAAIVMFLGAADSLVAAIRAGIVSRDDAHRYLIDVFVRFADTTASA